MTDRELIEKLKHIVDSAADVIDDAESIKLQSSAPYSYHDRHRSLPICVVFPRSTPQIVSIVQLCAKQSCAIVTIAANTSLEGQTVVPPTFHKTRHICLSTSRMKRTELHVEDGDIVCEPGVSFAALDKLLAPQGLVFPLDAGPGATVGGMLACGASGIRAVRCECCLIRM